MRKLLLIGLVALLASSCSTRKNENVLLEPNQNFTLVPASARNQIITNFLREKGQFEWNWADDNMLYSAVTDNNDGKLIVGYQPIGFDEESDIFNIQSEAWIKAKEGLIADILTTYEQFGFKKKREDIISGEHQSYPFFRVKVQMVELIKNIRASKNFRYAEPDTYIFTPAVASNTRGNSSGGQFGCNAPEIGLISPSDRVKANDNAYYSWHLKHANVDDAWNAGLTGDNIKVGLIDTGISPNQYHLNSGFRSGFSGGRSYFRAGTYKPDGSNTDGWQDQCGHGTSMASIIAGPRIVKNKPSGIAYKADFYAVRGTGDVLLDKGNEKDGVVDAIERLVNWKAKIISMSIGTPITAYSIRDAIKDGYKKGVMFVCAAGTVGNLFGIPISSGASVIFPANMGKETVAVTGVTEKSRLKTADRCIAGLYVDFVVAIERDGNVDRMALGMRQSGTLGDTSTDYVGGSSAATASFAGMAALIWSKNTSRSRDQVINIMKKSAEKRIQSLLHGWGRVDMDKARRE
ncbi:hypothetical protein BKI52_08745 [marine bacterium AO1-C]|nr:hypothetical protein BKI52_08745 [marine bacterium AO1-C]